MVDVFKKNINNDIIIIIFLLVTFKTSKVLKKKLLTKP